MCTILEFLFLSCLILVLYTARAVAFLWLPCDVNSYVLATLLVGFT